MQLVLDEDIARGIYLPQPVAGDRARRDVPYLLARAGAIGPGAPGASAPAR